MRLVTFALFIASCAVALDAQVMTPALGFETVAKPGATIGGLALPTDAQLDTVVLGDAGQVAFIAHWPDSATNSSERPGLIATVFTPRRIVARGGDMLDGGKILLAIAPDSPLAVNGSGQVAYAAWYADRIEDAERGFKLGVFVEKRLAFTAPAGSQAGPAFALTEDGEVVSKDAGQGQGAAPSQAPKTPGLLGRIHIKTPGGLPISITPPKQPTLPVALPALAPHPAAAMFPTNRRGQILVPVNFKDGGFLLLLGTPR